MKIELETEQNKSSYHGTLQPVSNTSSLQAVGFLFLWSCKWGSQGGEPEITHDYTNGMFIDPVAKPLEVTFWVLLENGFQSATKPIKSYEWYCEVSAYFPVVSKLIKVEWQAASSWKCIETIVLSTQTTSWNDFWRQWCADLFHISFIWRAPLTDHRQWDLYWGWGMSGLGKPCGYIVGLRIVLWHFRNFRIIAEEFQSRTVSNKSNQHWWKGKRVKIASGVDAWITI